MAFELSLKINNQEVEDSLSNIIVFNDVVIFNWDFETTNKVFVNPETGITSEIDNYSQSSYEIKISDTDVNIGKDSFVGNMVSTGVIRSQYLFWKYAGPNIQRGGTYYGQIEIVDYLGRKSDIKTFSFYYNLLPSAYNVYISPTTPSVTDDLQLNYSYSDGDGDLESGTIIRWFKNGVYQRQFDNALIIKSDFLQNNDIWNADVYPCDGYEYGSRVTSPHIVIVPFSVIVSELEIFPKNPNINDILKADYIVSDDFEYENILIRWYVNNLLIRDHNDKQEVRLDVSVGDSVRVEVKHSNSSVYVSSESVTVVNSDFVVKNIIVDGSKDPLDVSSITPNIKWNVFVPDDKELNYTLIEIGTFYRASNVYSTILEGDIRAFTIPQNILEKGKDYYLSISASDTQEFSRYELSHFRVNGNYWERNVSNLIGWTFETLFFATQTGDGHQFIRINDGSKFAEIRIYADKIRLISGSSLEYSVDTTSSRFLTVAGKEDNIKIYLDRELIIDGEGIFTQTSNIKRLEIGDYSSISGVEEDSFEVNYKYFSYTLSGYYLPGISREYSDLQFHTYMEFEENEIISLQGYTNGRYIFGLNPYNTNESSSIYAIKAGYQKNIPTVARTYSPVNRVSKSPDGKTIIFAHAHGVTIINGYFINNYNNEIDFTGSFMEVQYPESSGWEAVKSTDVNVSYFDGEGFNINTLG